MRLSQLRRFNLNFQVPRLATPSEPPQAPSLRVVSPLFSLLAEAVGL
jgi:hypothetical protein